MINSASRMPGAQAYRWLDDATTFERGQLFIRVVQHAAQDFLGVLAQQGRWQVGAHGRGAELDGTGHQF